MCCFFSGKDSDYKKHIINLIKKRKPALDRPPLQAYRVTYLHTVNIVAAMSSPKLNTFFIKIPPKLFIYKPIKKDIREAQKHISRISFSFNHLRHTATEKVSVAECVVDT